ncbi:hypothetical protein ACFQ1L_29050 [Phytohabitans flavus]|uniref:hypothetical protein n=1 Tax=Phytohabitans flavus TaxID=1076124 RepID=UPI0036311C45
MRLRGREPTFVVALPSSPLDDDERAAAPAAPPAPMLAPDGDEGGTSRINLRLPDHLKASIEQAAGRAGLSVNAWLVRAAAAAVESGDPQRLPPRRGGPSSGQQFTGWAR